MILQKLWRQASIKIDLPILLILPLRGNRISLLERIISHYPESINEQIIQNADKYFNDEMIAMSKRQKKTKLCKENKEQAINYIIRANNRLNFTRENALYRLPVIFIIVIQRNILKSRQ